MKKAKLFFGVITFLILVGVGINIFLNVYLKNSLNKALPGLKITGIIYVPPSGSLLFKTKYTHDNVELESAVTFVVFKLDNLLRKQMFIKKLYSKNINVSFRQFKTTGITNVEYIIPTQLLWNFPLKILIKNMQVKLNNETFFINTLSGENLNRNKVCLFATGKWRSYRFNISIINDLQKSRFLTKGNLLLPVVGLIVGPHSIDFELTGNYSLDEFKDLKISLIGAKEKYTIYGKMKIYPLEIDADIKTEVVQGKLSFSKKDDVTNIVYDGSFKFGEEVKKRLGIELLGDLKTKIIYSKKPDMLTVFVEMKNRELDVNSEVHNNKGNFKIKLGKKYISGGIFYDDKQRILLLKDNRGGKNINLLLGLHDKNNGYDCKGVFFGYALLCQGIFENDKKVVNLSLDKTGTEQLIFHYVSTASLSTAKFYYKNIPKNLNVDTKLFYSVEDGTNITMSCKNIEIHGNKLSFNASIKTTPNRNSLDKQLYNVTASLNDLYLNRFKMLEDVFITGSYYDDIIRMSGKSADNSIDLEGEWNLKNNILSLTISVSRKNLKLGEITVKNVAAKILINKDRVININYNYSLSDLSYNKLTIAKAVSGGGFYDFDRSCLLLNGDVIFSSQVRGKYKTDFFLNRNKIYVELSNLSLPDVLKLSQAELWFDFAKSNFVLVSGRIYDSSSEIIISSGTINLDKKNVLLTTKVKNLIIKNTNVFCDLNLETSFGDAKKVEVITRFKNLWINNYLLGSLATRCVICLDKRVISFRPFDTGDKNAYLLGDVIINHNRVEFSKLRFVLLENRVLLLDGKIGSKNDLLTVKLNSFPVEVLSGILYTPLPVSSGQISADFVFITSEPGKKMYDVNGSFNIQNLEFATLKLYQVTGKISTHKDYFNFENINFIFRPDSVMILTGAYNIRNKNLELTFYSQKCNLSIFEGFMDIVKTAEGNFVVDLKIKGKPQEPKLYGYIYLPKGKIVFKKYAKYLNNVSCKLTFTGSQLKIDKCRAEYEQTKLFIDGDYDITKEKYLIRIRTEGGSGIFMEIPELSFYPSEVLKIFGRQKGFVSNGNLHFDLMIKKHKKLEPPIVTGNIVMNNTNFTYPGTEGKRIASISSFYYDIILCANNNVWYENESLSANIVGKVHFKLTEGMKKSDVNGEVQALRGKVKFLNTQLDIRSGEVEIIKRDVYITLEAEAEVFISEREKIPVKLTISRAKIENIQPKLYTPVYPQLTTEELTSLMLGAGKLQKYGDKVEVYAAKKIDYLPYLKAQILKIIDVTLAEPISRNILQKWGIADKFVVEQVMPASTIEMAQQETSLMGTTGMTAVDIVKDIRYGIEKYLTPDMAISYSITLAEVKNKLNLKHEFEISYRLKDNIFIKGVYDYAIRDYDTGRYSGDIRIQIEPRFKLKSWTEEEKAQHGQK